MVKVTCIYIPGAKGRGGRRWWLEGVGATWRPLGCCLVGTEGSMWMELLKASQGQVGSGSMEQGARARLSSFIPGRAEEKDGMDTESAPAGRAVDTPVPGKAAPDEWMTPKLERSGAPEKGCSWVLAIKWGWRVSKGPRH